MSWQRVAPVALLIAVACTVVARPAPAPAAPRAVLGATAAPAVLTVPPEAAEQPQATVAPVIAALPAPTSLPDLAPGRTAAETARHLAAAIDALDLRAMRRLIHEGGWVFAYPGGDMSLRLTRDEAISWIRARTPDGRIRAETRTEPVLRTTPDHPPGTAYVRSVWTAFERKDRVRVDLVLTAASDGLWYWSGILIGAPD